MIRKLLLIILLLVLGGILAWQELERRWQAPLSLPADGMVLVVAQGESLRAVANRLYEDGVLPYPKLLVAFGRWTGIDQQIKHGEYLLIDPLDPAGLLELLRSGKVIQYTVTVPEGVTLTQALAILAAQAELESVLEGPEDERIQAMVKPFDHPEGLFFPDTYHYTRNTSDLELLRRANEKMLSVLEEEWQGRAQELPYETPYEALIMASIIERETGLPEERQEIAGVFVRRLLRGMRLQTDPTVIYGAGPEFDGNLRRSHLNDENNIYNTYRIDGLPPTPIALPGRAAIHAALHPAEGTTLFFVARGDGGHVFSNTLKQHEAAVRKYQLQRRKDYRSSPEEN
ncbi:MAG: endolytic transglycosylase MltG [Halieaceae bacterium]|nr:endolytic transglycosylase MltG [Halieaceae bacterium]